MKIRSAKQEPGVIGDLSFGVSHFITVVSGIPRSGTSLMMQMLGAGGADLLVDGLREPSEDNPRGFFEYEPVRDLRQDASWVFKAQGMAIKIIALMLDSLPRNLSYKVVLMRRDLREVVASQAKMLERLGQRGPGLDADALIGLFQRQMEDAERLLQQDPAFEGMTLDYGELIREPDAAASRVDTFLGRTLDVRAMAAVIDPALHRQRASG